MDNNLFSPSMETHNLFLDDDISEKNSYDCFGPRENQGDSNLTSKNLGFQTFGRTNTNLSCSQDTPYLKESFKPRKIRRSRSHLNPCRSRDVMEIETEKDILKRKKQRNSFTSLCSLENDSFFIGSQSYNNTIDTIMSPTKTTFASVSSNCKNIYLTPTREELSMKSSNINVESHIHHILNLNIKLLAIDFDQTLLSIHTNGEWRKSAMYLSQYVRPVFKALIPPLLRKGIIISIVTFSPQLELVERVLNLTFKECILGKNIFICGGENPILKAKPSKIREFGTQLSVKMFFPSKNALKVCSNGKCAHLNMIFEELRRRKKNIKPDQVLYIDDDSQNISLCQQNTPLIFSLVFRCCNSEVESENWFLNSILQL